MKKVISLVVIVLILGALLFWFNQSDNGNTATQKITIAYNIESINHAPMMIAVEKDLFIKHGINAKLIAIASSSSILQGISTGQIDIGTAGSARFFTPISKGAPIKILSPVAIAASRVYVRPNSGIKTFADLSGKKMALKPTNGTGYAINYALLKEGVDISTIEFLDIERTYQPMALMEQKIVDATGVGEFEQSTYREIGAELLEEWGTKGYLEEKIPRAAVGVNTNFLIDNHDLVDRFIDALVESHIFIKENPEEAAQLVADHVNEKTENAVTFTAEEILETWQDTEYLLWVEPEVLTNMAKVAKEFNQIEKAISGEEVLILEFQNKLKKAQIEVYGE